MPYSTIMTSLETCSHRFLFDTENSEIVCEKGCGWVVPIFEDKALKNAPSEARLSSPSVENHGLGTDINGSVRDLRRRATDPTTGKRVHLLSGGLKQFYQGPRHSDEDLVVELSNRLHGRVSDSDLAAIAAIYRRELKSLDREKRAKAVKLLDQITNGADNRA